MTETIAKEDWERFRALGSVPGSIREVVLRSWVRSQETRNVEALRCAPSIAQDELHMLRQRSSRLRIAARRAIRRAGYMLHDSGMMVLLCDREAVVMDAGGDARILSRGEENHLQPGGRWNESAIGTNAIGTALHTGNPVTIRGVEHFCEAIQRWSCAAAPIRDPFSGTVLGVVDVSGPSGDSFGQAAAFSVSLAMQIEEALRSTGLQEHRRLCERLLAQRSAPDGDEVMILDRYGAPVWSSAAFNTLAGDLCSAPALPDLAEPTGDPSLLAERMRQALPEAGVDVLGERGDAIGVVVTLPRRNPRADARQRAVPDTMRDSAPDPRVIALDQIAATGPALAAICARAARITGGGVPLLIRGPVGSGKETLARALHQAGPLAALPFRIIDCSLLDAAGLRRDLSNGAGLMALSARGGTLCLDEPAQTAAGVQPLLAQALALLGRDGQAPLQVISLATLAPDEPMAAERMIGDLHFRILAAELQLPPLCERRADVAGLVRRFAGLCSGGDLRFTQAAMLCLQTYNWPGNLREMRNLIESLSATSLSRVIDVADLPPRIVPAASARREEPLRDRERAGILNTLAEAGGNMTEAARRLGISRSTLYLKLDQYGLPRSRRR